ncbi:phosphoglycerate mutase-like protein [Cucurbitaria berberidis CBS 394.84]|uniref:Phosphoglycerate mutase-like protein n=1 Tax=Cucurbitaria berberidis CBS 394.84 TaxID=1168544 RepID=A0A9P4GMD3_9PLEO|nr:phosphoglycerate mutase-like protein [Cucurbitaria berberidis CBS 394.84]KAF1847706.1 phosphoglycerate mutase-like protein [Cucurbitaria berberidis CBS 394.84]
MSPHVHIIRHGEGVHNVERGYPHRDPPLTAAGAHATTEIQLAIKPDLILISPMTRTIQTAMNIFPSLEDQNGAFAVPVQIWPDLREAHDAICNKGLSRAELQSKFAQFDFSECHEEWDYPAHSVEGARARAESVRQRLKDLSITYQHIVIVTHRCFISYLVQGTRFDLCEMRSYIFKAGRGVHDDKFMEELKCDKVQEQDFGPTVLVPHDRDGKELTDTEAT